MTTKKALISGVLGLAVFTVVFVTTSHGAHAQFVGSGCPSASVWYANGYSNNYCVPSFYPGYPQTPSNGIPGYGTGYGNGNGYYYGGNYGPNYGYYTPHPYLPQTNPFQPPVYNQPFYPYAPVPTYYYPPAPQQPWHRRGPGYM